MITWTPFELSADFFVISVNLLGRANRYVTLVKIIMTTVIPLAIAQGSNDDQKRKLTIVRILGMRFRSDVSKQK